eukprot:7490710-Alexandrium_andersonii.AAC.1
MPLCCVRLTTAGRDGSNQLFGDVGIAPERLILGATRGGGIPGCGGGLPRGLAPGRGGLPDRGGGFLGRLGLSSQQSGVLADGLWAQCRSRFWRGERPRQE